MRFQPLTLPLVQKSEPAKIRMTLLDDWIWIYSSVPANFQWSCLIDNIIGSTVAPSKPVKSQRVQNSVQISWGRSGYSDLFPPTVVCYHQPSLWCKKSGMPQKTPYHQLQRAYELLPVGNSMIGNKESPNSSPLGKNLHRGRRSGALEFFQKYIPILVPLAISFETPYRRLFFFSNKFHYIQQLITYKQFIRVSHMSFPSNLTL